MKDKYLVPIVISTTKAKALKMSDIRRERESCLMPQQLQVN